MAKHVSFLWNCPTKINHIKLMWIGAQALDMAYGLLAYGDDSRHDLFSFCYHELSALSGISAGDVVFLSSIYNGKSYGPLVLHLYW